MSNAGEFTVLRPDGMTFWERSPEPHVELVLDLFRIGRHQSDQHRERFLGDRLSEQDVAKRNRVIITKAQRSKRRVVILAQQEIRDIGRDPPDPHPECCRP